MKKKIIAIVSITLSVIPFCGCDIIQDIEPYSVEEVNFTDYQTEPRNDTETVTTYKQIDLFSIETYVTDSNYTVTQPQIIDESHQPDKVQENNISNTTNRKFVKTFSTGTYFSYEKSGIMGASGRILKDCGIKPDEIKGSISCKYLCETYGYFYNGNATTVYLDISEYPTMSGLYTIDDYCEAEDTINFYFDYTQNCPFAQNGITTFIDCYIVE